MSMARYIRNVQEDFFNAFYGDTTMQSAMRFMVENMGKTPTTADMEKYRKIVELENKEGFEKQRKFAKDSHFYTADSFKKS